MCGRFTLREPLGPLVERFMARLVAELDWPPRYNIAPTQEALVIRSEEGERVAAPLRWGLVPSWAKDTKLAASMTNARAETVAEKPAFRAAFKKRRCLVPADGYYEWRREGKLRLPHLYQIHGGEPFAFAGLWERWQDLETFTILTTSANALAAQVHDRMPVILSPLDSARWLDPASDPNALLRILEPYPAADMTDTPVSTYVNNSRHEGPDCISPVPESGK
jgi:putative SOS response-associated peptidase YedK